MKDEIKEILDEMYHIICTYSDDYDYFEENKINFELSYKNMEKLYDYITNLQEGNERLNNIINELEKWLNENWNKPLAKIYVADVVKKISELKENNKE